MCSSLARAMNLAAHTPSELARAIELSLSLGSYSLAAELSRLGSQIFPEHEQLKRAAQALRSPVVRRVPTPKAEGLDDSRTWVRKEAAKYHGRWVVVHKGTLLGAAERLKELETVIGQAPEGALVTKVL